MLWRKKTPTVIQMEAMEGGAACLSIILGYWGCFIPLEQLRLDCGVSRDGSNAPNIIKAAKKYGLEAKKLQKTTEALQALEAPAILLWEYKRFVVLEGFGKKNVFINDPAVGPHSLTYEEFKEGYSGSILIFTPTDTFQKQGKPTSLSKELFERIKNVPIPFLYLVLAGVCLLLPGLALPAFARIFVDRILLTRVMEEEWLFLLSMLLVAIIGGTLIWLQMYFLNRLNGRLSIQFSSQFVWHILRLPIAFYTQRYPGEIAYRATLNNRVAQQITGPLASTCINLLLVIFYGLAMLQYDLLIGALGFAAALLNIFVFVWIQRSRSDAYARWQQELGKWIGNSIGSLQYMETIKAIGIESDVFSRYAGYYTKNINALQQIGKKDAILGTVPVLMQALAMAGLLVIGSLRVMTGHLTFGMLIALQTLMISFLMPIIRFVNFGQIMQNIKTDVGRLNDVLKNSIDPLYQKRCSLVPANLSLGRRLEGYIEFRHVTFGYSPLAPPLIKNLSFIIKPGQRLALVGTSGCGKSTIAKLAVGLFAPWQGEILYDGTPIEAIPADMFYHSLGHVDQQIFLFSGTIQENITLWNTAVTQQMLVQAAEDSGMHDEIMQKDKGYQHVLTEGGKNLSGGQRQRLEITRALVYSPSVLVMDEATSALDSETEKMLSDNIRRKGCSVLMIAHRLSTIQDCDEILVLQQGEIIGRGTHAQLETQCSFYQKLIENEAVRT